MLDSEPHTRCQVELPSMYELSMSGGMQQGSCTWLRWCSGGDGEPPSRADVVKGMALDIQLAG